MKAWVTVIIPAFNRGVELERSLFSLVNQSNQDFNVVICDDGSSISINNIVDKFKFHLNILLLRIENSGGPARPRNTALKHVNTKWVCFLDSDDWWSEFKLEKVKLYIDKYDFIYHKMNVVNGSTGKKIGVIGKRYRDLNLIDGIMTCGNKIPTSSVMIKFEIIKNNSFNENIRLASYEDVNTWINIFYTNCVKVKFVNKSLGFYTISIDSISKLSKLQIMKYLFFYKKNINKVSNSQLKFAESYKNYIIGTQFLNLGNYKNGILFLNRVTRLNSKADILKLFIKKIYCLIKLK